MFTNRGTRIIFKLKTCSNISLFHSNIKTHKETTNEIPSITSKSLLKVLGRGAGFADYKVAKIVGGGTVILLGFIINVYKAAETVQLHSTRLQRKKLGLHLVETAVEEETFI